MARTRTLTDLILDVRQRAGMENSTFVTPAEITEYLNQELAELYWHLVTNEGQVHLRSSGSISVVAGTATYALSGLTSFWQLQGVEATINGIVKTLRPFNEAERADLQLDGTIHPVRYRIQGANIEFLPATETFTATVYFTPHQTRLATDSDTFDGYNGFEIAAIYGTVAQCLAKEESDPTFWEMRKDKVYAQIDALAARRDVGAPERVQDVVGWEGFL